MQLLLEVVPRWLLFDGMVPNKASAYGASLTRRLDVCVAGMPETESGDLFVEGVPKVNPPFQGALVHRGDFPVLCQCPCKSPACNKKCRRKKGEEQRRLDNAVCVCAVALCICHNAGPDYVVAACHNQQSVRGF